MILWAGASIGRRVSMIAGAVGATFAAMISVMNFTETAEPHWLATRSFVRESVRDAQKVQAVQFEKLNESQRRTEIFLAQSEQRRIENAINEKQNLLRDNSAAAPALRDAVSSQVQELQTDLARVKSLAERLQSGSH